MHLGADHELELTHALLLLIILVIVGGLDRMDLDQKQPRLKYFNSFRFRFFLYLEDLRYEVDNLLIDDCDLVLLLKTMPPSQ